MKNLYYRIRNYLQLRKYRKMHHRAKMIAVFEHIAQMKEKPFERFTDGLPLDKDKISAQADRAKEKKLDTLYFGDSIGAFLKDNLESVDPDGNFCRPGDTGDGFRKVIEQVCKVEDFSNMRNVIIGTFGNNALHYQHINFIKKEILEVYKLARLNFPDAKIIWIGFPPVYDIYANMVAPVVEAYMKGLDENSCIIDLAGFGNGLFPSLQYSSDGIHLSEYGGYRFDQLVEKAKV